MYGLHRVFPYSTILKEIPIFTFSFIIIVLLQILFQDSHDRALQRLMRGFRLN